MNKLAATCMLTWLGFCFSGSSPAAAQTCVVPNQIANGQVADASNVMGNFDAIAACTEQRVTTTGTPVTGSIATVSGPKTIESGNLTGDVTTSGGTVTTLSNTGVTPGSYSSPYLTVDAKGRVTAASNGSGAGGGGVWIVAYSWTSTTNGTLSPQTINVDVSAYSELMIIYDQITKSSAGPVTTVFSVDGGATFDWANNYHSNLNDNGTYNFNDNAVYENGHSSDSRAFNWYVPAIRTTGPKPYFGSRPGMYVNYAPITNVGLVIPVSYTGGAIRVLAR